jgi:hypothetical protein
VTIRSRMELIKCLFPNLHESRVVLIWHRVTCTSYFRESRVVLIWHSHSGSERCVNCYILAQCLIELIEYSYQQGIPSFPKTHLQRTLGFSVLGSEQFRDEWPTSKSSRVRTTMDNKHVFGLETRWDGTEPSQFLETGWSQFVFD